MKTSRPLIQGFVRKGHTKVVVYLAMLEPDLEKRATMMTKVICYAQDAKMAQLLMGLGGKLDQAGDVLLGCCLRRNLELLRFFVKNGGNYSDTPLLRWGHRKESD